MACATYHGSIEVIRGESEFESSFLIVHADLTLIDIIEVF
jgi:hypothetical protein